MSIFNGKAENIEDNRNKVTQINENSNNVEYPSANAVYNFTKNHLKFKGNVRELPDKNNEGDVCVVCDVDVYVDTLIAHDENSGDSQSKAWFLPEHVTSFDVHFKTDDYQAQVGSGYSYLKVVSDYQDQEPSIPIWNFEGDMECWLHYQIESGNITVTGKQVLYESGLTVKDTLYINQTVPIPNGFQGLDFLCDFEITENGKYLYYGCGLSKIEITSPYENETDCKPYLNNGFKWLYLSGGDDAKPKKVVFSDNATLTLEDNTMYVAETPINVLTIIYPETDFICSVDFTVASEGDVTITLPTSKYIGTIPTFNNGTTWELNIKNGVVVGGKVE